jgi:hypothetical protein
MNANEVLFISAAVMGSGGTVIFARRRRQQNAERDVAAGTAPTVIAAIRRLNAGPWRGRWRHGFVTVMPGEVAWRPRRPRPGPPIRLANVHLHGRPRRQLWHEHWWLAPGMRIYQLTGDAPGEFELAVVAESSRLFEDQIGRRPGVR